MVTPKIKRINTVGIRYVKGDRSEGHYEYIIEDLLGIPISEIKGLGACGQRRFMLKISSSSRYRQICKDFVGKTIHVDNTHDIQIDDISTYKDRIRVTNVPFEFHNVALRKLLSQYGKVEHIDTCRIREGRLSGIMNLERTVWMVVEHPIPSSLFVKETDSYMYLSYNTQPPTCNKCGDLRHKAFACNVSRNKRPEERENAVTIDLSDFPDTLNQTQEEQDSEESSEELIETTTAHVEVSDQASANSIPLEVRDEGEIHFASSQSENNFLCTECEYACSYENVLKVHMATHIEKNEIKCIECGIHYISQQALYDHICDIKNSNKITITLEDPKDHIQKHLGEKPYSCLECGQEYITKEDYEDHMKSHTKENPFTCTVCHYQCNEQKQLNDHIIIHTGENSFSCKECEYKCSAFKDLVHHMLSHSKEKPINCSKCNYTFTTEIELNLHMKNHSGELTIDNLYSAIVKSPPKNRESSNSGIERRYTRLTSSQQQTGRGNDSHGAMKRGLSLSPELNASNKKQVTQRLAN